jgi:hypothetical protein
MRVLEGSFLAQARTGTPGQELKFARTQSTAGQLAKLRLNV